MIRPSRNWVLPLLAFTATLVFHYVFLGFFPEQDPSQAGWAVLPAEESWLSRYVAAQNYWIGYSYALCLAFVTAASRHYWRTRCGASGGIALGGLGFSGALAVAGCFLIGCCGSPMLIVWLNLFGAAFLPLAKPLMAVITTVSVGAAWLWLRRKMFATSLSGQGCC